MPALNATQYNEPFKQLYQRVIEKNPTLKRKGVVACMRKMLILVFVLWEKGEEFDPNYQWNVSGEEKEPDNIVRKTSNEDITSGNDEKPSPLSFSSQSLKRKKWA